MKAKQLIDEYINLIEGGALRLLFKGGPSAPVKEPTTRPGIAPAKPAAPEPRPGTKPWKIPTIRPGEETKPKAKKEDDTD
jgi:hypothetical protein